MLPMSCVITSTLRTYHLSKQVVQTILVFLGEDPPTARWRLRSNRNSTTLPWCDNDVRCNGRLRPFTVGKVKMKPGRWRMERDLVFMDVMKQNLLDVFIGMGDAEGHQVTLLQPGSLGLPFRQTSAEMQLDRYFGCMHKVFHEEMGTLQSYILRMEEKCHFSALVRSKDLTPHILTLQWFTSFTSHF